MRQSNLLPMVKGYPNEALINALSPESHYLVDLDDQFSGMTSIRKLRLVSVYETRRTQTVQVIVSLGSVRD